MNHDVPRQPPDPGHIPPSRETRIGDAERTRALDLLAGYLETGHLTISDFEERSAAVPGCRTISDLEVILADLPMHGDVSRSATARPVSARVSGLRTRIGIFLLIGVLCMTASATAGNPLPLIVWVLAAIALFILNVGPDRWYTPSLRQLERRNHHPDGNHGE
ncbi:DUF1707 domain-containing protein [Corynebacterium sp. CCM 9203]|uniref:DUF1707 SHOCT-like domain-containing protein n=1 Tax=Corynebacterium sp. CCM 9203 TaxID=3057615 RepID=UPI0035259AF4